MDDRKINLSKHIASILIAALPVAALAQEGSFNTEQNVVVVEESEVIQRIKREITRIKREITYDYAYRYGFILDTLLDCDPENGELEQALNLLGKHQISINDRNAYGLTLLDKAFYTSSISYGKRIPLHQKTPAAWGRSEHQR